MQVAGATGPRCVPLPSHWLPESVRWRGSGPPQHAERRHPDGGRRVSIRVMNWVWEHSTAKGSELLLLLAIADAADDHGRNAFPSISTLAAKTRMSRRTVQRLVVKLEDDGHLILQRAGGCRANTYEVVLGRPPEPSPQA